MFSVRSLTPLERVLFGLGLLVAGVTIGVRIAAVLAWYIHAR
ncbi:MAG TPA: hypothetical protein VFI95_02985 [Terriglobales bacterium]|nr:hypothetical protein [Terriglobales bacterium]